MSRPVELPDPPKFLRLFSHPFRWKLLVVLASSDHRVHELADILGKPVNLVSYHLGRLRSMNLVTEQRSDVDGRDLYYRANLDQLRDLFNATAGALHPFLLEEPTSQQKSPVATLRRPARVLFLCTHNSARSQMAEGILRKLGGDEVEVFSAGTKPSRIHPLAVRAMAEMGIDISRQRSKHLEEFLGESFDYVITVCNRFAENCPHFPGDPRRIHWSFPDPAAMEGTEAGRYNAFRHTARELAKMIQCLLIIIKKEKRETKG